MPSLKDNLWILCKDAAVTLDALNSGWAEILKDAESIEMDSCTRCILGRIYGLYNNAPSIFTEGDLSPAFDPVLVVRPLDPENMFPKPLSDERVLTIAEILEEHWRTLIKQRNEESKS